MGVVRGPKELWAIILRFVYRKMNGQGHGPFRNGQVKDTMYAATRDIPRCGTTLGKALVLVVFLLMMHLHFTFTHTHTHRFSLVNWW